LSLAKVYTLLNEFDQTEKFHSNEWNNTEFRKWLIIHDRPGLAAKLAADAGSFDEALNIWHEMAENQGHYTKDQNFNLGECLEHVIKY